MILRPIYYDTETTGIKTDKDRIVEIAAFDPVNNKTFEMLVNPGCPIPQEASAVHKITDDMVSDSPSFAEVALEFVKFCEGDVVLIAHNNDNFDLPLIRNEFVRHNVIMPDTWKFMDSLKWARRYRSDLPRHTLQFLRENYGITANNAHRALDDVIVLYQMFSQMIDDLTMEDVLLLINKPVDILHMPFGKYQGKPLQEVPADYLKWLIGSGAFEKAENQELKRCFEKQKVFQGKVSFQATPALV
jgi:DNA polymerase-3 subunit epsilon